MSEEIKELRKEFGEDFRQLLETYGMSMGDAGRMFGVSVVNISNVIRGKLNEQPPKKDPVPLPACVNNSHCQSRRINGDGECGCWHDSLGMLLKEGPPK